MGRGHLSATFSDGLGRVALHTNDPETDAWCRRHLRLYAEHPETPVPEGSRFDLHHVVLPEGELERRSAELPVDVPVALYTRRQGLAADAAGDRCLIRSNVAREGPRIYLRESNSIALLSERPDRFAKLECARIVRDVLCRQRESAGHPILHASCAASSKGALLFVGSKYAGKTSCMLTCLNAGMDLVGNDRVFLAECADGVEAHAWVSTTNLSLKSFEGFPPLQPLLRRDYEQAYPIELREVSERFWDDLVWPGPDRGKLDEIEHKVVLVDEEVSGAFGVARRGRGRLRALVFPEVASGAGEPALQDVSAADVEKQLTAEAWSLSEEEYFPDVFRLRRIDRDGMHACVRELAARVHESMPCLRVRTGFDRLPGAIEQVSRVAGLR